MMLGSPCSPCCTPCGCPPGESLPEAVTVAFSGLTKSATYVDNLLGLSITACYGSGASGKVSSGGGKPDDGFPISGVTLTSGGSGYAKLGRAAPTLSVSGSGTGATFAPTFSVSNDSCGLPRWSVASIGASGGTGYVDGEQVTITPAAGSTEEESAIATVSTERAAPTVTASASGGTGATFGVTIAANGTMPQTWSVTGVTVKNGGTGYPSTGIVAFNVANGDTVEMGAYAEFRTGRTQPTLAVSAGGSGSGAVLSASLASATGWDGLTYWYLSGVSITNGGGGYAELDPISISVTDGEGYGAYAEVSSVDENGAITSVSVWWGGEYYKSSGIIESVQLYDSGNYYRDTGAIASISVNYGGLYYREDASLPPHVAQVTVSVTQAEPSHGTGAVITASVDDNTASATFGQITGLTIIDGGNGYLSWSWRLSDCPVSRFNGKSFLVGKTSHDSCVYRRCDGASTITVSYNGKDNPPTVLIRGECNIDFIAGEGDAPFPCSAINFEASEILGGTAHVAGGDPDLLPTCTRLFNATSVTLQVEGQDWTAALRIGTPGQFCASQQLGFFPGSAYAGTFELTYHSTLPNGSRRFRYYYEASDAFCGESPLLELVVPPPESAQRNTLSLSGLVTRAYDSSGPLYTAEDDPNELGCDEFSVFNGICNREVAYLNRHTSQSVGCAAVPCDVFSFQLSAASRAFVVSSDGPRPPIVETGSRLLPVTFLAFSDE